MSAATDLEPHSAGALEALPFSVCVFDAAHALVFANRAAAALIGGPERPAPLSASLREVVRSLAYRGELGPGDPEALAAQILALDHSRPLRHLLRRMGGGTAEYRSIPLPEGGGFCAVFQDISELVAAAEEAEARAAALETVLAHLESGVALYGPDRRLVLTSPRYEALNGLPQGTLRPGMTQAEVVGLLAARGEFANTDTDATAAERLTRDRAVPHSLLRERPNGTVLQIESRPVARGGHLVEITDVTALKRAEAEARQRAALLQVTLDNIRHGIALYGPDRRLRLANALAASLAGVGPDDLRPGQTLDELIDLQIARGAFGAGPEAVARAETLKRLDRSRHHQGRRRLPDGRQIELVSDPTPDGGFVVVWTDISALAEAEEAARQRAAVLQGTLDGVRHGIALYGPDRRLLAANRLASPAQGLPELEKRIGLHFDDLVREQKALGIFGEGERAERICREVIALDRSQSHRYQRPLPDGRVVEVRSDPTPDGGFVITHTDVTDLVQAQADASRRAALLQVMLDGMRHGIALFDAEHRLVAANRLAATLTGLGHVSAMRGRTIGELLQRQVEVGEVPPEVAARHRALDRSVPSRVMRERPDGTVLEVTSDPTPDGGFIVTYTDVTALTRLEEESRRRADILQVMLDNMRHGICYYGPDRRVIAANALAAELAGYPPGFVAPGRTLDEQIARQAETGVLDPGLARMALRMDRSRPHRYARPHKDGRVVEVTSDPMPDGGFVITMSDVTALVEAEAEARRRAAIQQVMLDTIRHGILLVDAAGRVVAANRVLRELLDLPEEVVAPGRPFTDLVDMLEARGEYGEGAEGAAVAAAIRTRDRSRSIRTVRTRPDGTVLEAVSDPTPDGGWVLTFTDITAERRAQAELERARDAAEAANRAKSRFLATMSHELRTPLNAVIGFSEALLAMPKEAMEPDYVRAIQDAGRHLLSLIDDILDVARAETTGFEISEAVVDLARLVEGAMRVMGAAASVARVALHTNLAPDLPRVRADELRLRQVLLNLLSNAVKFTPAEGRVTLAAARDPARGGVTIRISDTGIGMRPEDIPRAFEPFTQLESTLSRRFPGSGLGLYLSRALAAAQGAELTLESRPGEGTTAVLHLPPERLVAPQDG